MWKWKLFRCGEKWSEMGLFIFWLENRLGFLSKFINSVRNGVCYECFPQDSLRLVLSLLGFCSTHHFHGNDPSCVLLLWSKPGKFKFGYQNGEKKMVNIVILILKICKLSMQRKPSVIIIIIIVNNLLTEHWGPWSLRSVHTATTSGQYSTQVPNNVNFIVTELSGAHCKHPWQVQEQSERWRNVVARAFVVTLPWLA